MASTEAWKDSISPLPHCIGTCSIPSGRFAGGSTAQLYSHEIAVLASWLRSEVGESELENAIPRLGFEPRRTGLVRRGTGAARDRVKTDRVTRTSTANATRLKAISWKTMGAAPVKLDYAAWQAEVLVPRVLGNIDRFIIRFYSTIGPSYRPGLKHKSSVIRQKRPSFEYSIVIISLVLQVAKKAATLVFRFCLSPTNQKSDAA